VSAARLAEGPAIKICGLTREQDVITARDLGVWAVGFVFAESPRRVAPTVARRLVEGAGLGGGSGRPDVSGVAGRPLTVGVFTDSSVEEIVRVVEEVGLDAVQLHGINGPAAGEVVKALGEKGEAVLIIQAVPVDVDEDDARLLRSAVAEATRQADIVLLDTRVSAGAGEFGGTGRSFRWTLAREALEVAGRTPLLVAGGVGPDSVLEALAESGAWGVDVSSGVESAPGIKDAILMKRLVARVKEGIGK